MATYAHELGHGLSALLLGEKFDQLILHADGSGMALWHGKPGRMKTALIASGGLIGPTVAGITMLLLSSSPRFARRVLAVLAAAYPSVAFTVEHARRGYRVVTWTGGPWPAGVECAATAGGLLPLKTRFHRHPTREELDAMHARWDREDAERKAAEPARKAAAKLAAVNDRPTPAKKPATRSLKKAPA